MKPRTQNIICRTCLALSTLALNIYMPTMAALGHLNWLTGTLGVSVWLNAILACFYWCQAVTLKTVEDSNKILESMLPKSSQDRLKEKREARDRPDNTI